MTTLSTSRERQRVRDSHGYDPAKDPWSVMTPEDRREAHRLWKAAMRAMPGSRRQEELHAKMEAILKRYGIGKERG